MEHSVLVIAAIVRNDLHFEKSWADIESDPHLLNCVKSKSNFLEIHKSVCTLVYKVYSQFSVQSNEKKIPYTDTERLDFLLSEICIDDIGDEESVKGICIRYEDLENRLTCGDNYTSNIETWEDDLRDVIDRAIGKFQIRQTSS